MKSAKTEAPRTKNPSKPAKKKSRAISVALSEHRLKRTKGDLGTSSTKDNLVNAASSAGVVIDKLRGALETAGAVEGLVILDLIESARLLKGRVDQVVAAIDQEPEYTPAER